MLEQPLLYTDLTGEYVFVDDIVATVLGGIMKAEDIALGAGIGIVSDN